MSPITGFYFCLALKITFCAHDRPDNVNGPNVWLYRLLTSLRRKGYHCEILFFPFGETDRCITITKMIGLGFVCRIYEGKPYTEHKIRWILNRLKESPPDVFVPNLNVPAYYASKYLQEAGIPAIGMIRSNDKFYRSIAEEFLESDDRYLSAVVAVSDYLKEYCEEKKTDPSILVENIPSGTPVPSGRASYSSPLRLIYTGRLVNTQKRILSVVKGFCNVSKSIDGVEAVIYGEGPARENVEKIIHAYKADSHVSLGGLIDNDALQEKLLSAHVFVLMSEFEGLPVSLMEAMACGVVPVCYSIESGVSEIITDGENGLLIKDRNRSFTEAIKKLRYDRELWQKLSDNARYTAETQYSMSAVTEKWVDLIEKVSFSGGKLRGEVEVPDRIELPPKHPGIRNFEDKRWPGYITHFHQSTKSKLRSGYNKLINI
jgi:colanic acid/amylovoran biosynthesis glycosyltransferase